MPAPVSDLPIEGATRLPPRQCGRCRSLFEGDPSSHATALPDWWLCPPCRTVLFGTTPGPDEVAPTPYVA